MLLSIVSLNTPVRTPQGIGHLVHYEFAVSCTIRLYTANQFLLDCSKEGLRTGIVIAIAFGTHTLQYVA
jgi:hypothetical protein